MRELRSGQDTAFILDGSNNTSGRVCLQRCGQDVGEARREAEEPRDWLQQEAVTTQGLQKQGGEQRFQGLVRAGLPRRSWQ